MMEEKKSEKIAMEIKNLVIEKKFLPGQKLPNERKLAEEMGVSRTVLREALGSLNASGVIEIKRGVGTFISEHPGIVDDPLGLEYIGDKDQLLKHWYEVRLILEPEAVYLATKRANEKDISIIKKLEAKIREQVKNKEHFMEEDLKFHTELAKATHNPIISRLIPLIYKSSNIDITFYQSDKWYERAKNNAIETHAEILNFVLKRDAEGARLASRYHLIRALEDVNYK